MDQFDPLDPSFLRTRERSEVPPKNGRRIAGDKYPSRSDLREFLVHDPRERLGAKLDHACPIIGTEDGGRDVLYGVPLMIPARRRDAHLAAWGPTGTGKTSRVVLPLLNSDIHDSNRCLVVFSLKGEEYPLLVSSCRAQERELVAIDLSDPGRSLGFNPLAGVDESGARDQIAAFVEQVANRDARETEFWRREGMRFLEAGWYAGSHSFPGLLDFYERSRDDIINELEACTHPSASSVASFIRGGSSNADTVLATVASWLNAFRDPAVRATTGTQELDRETLFKRPRVIYVRCPEARLPALRSVYNVILQWMIDAAIDSEDHERASISFYVEDLPAWGPIPSLVDRLATLRSRRISMHAAIQSMAQLRYAYGPTAAEATEKAFVNKVVLPGVDPEDAHYFARSSGEQQVLVRGEECNGIPVARYVLTASDIRSPGWRHFLYGRPATFLLQDVIFQAYLCPFYLQPKGVHLAASCEVIKPPLRSEPLLVPERPKRGATAPTPRPGRFTDTRGLSEERLKELIEDVRNSCGWSETSGSARLWWESFEKANAERKGLVLRLLEELMGRSATIAEFFGAHVYANTDNIQANLHYLDYTRLKKEGDQKKQTAQKQNHKGADVDATQTKDGGM
jgi:hypothetical protein